MNEDIAQLVRDGLDRLTADVTVPAELAARARRQHHRRNAAIGSAVTATAAAVAVIAVVTASLAGAPSPSPGRPGTGASLDAAIVTRAELALAASTGDVAEASTTMMFNGTTIRVFSWSDSRGSRTELAVSGQPPQAGGYVLHAGSVTFATIDYRSRTWRQTSLPDAKVASTALPAAVASLQAMFSKQLQAVTRRCPAASPPRPDMIAFSWATYIRRLLGCGTLKIAAYGTVDGMAATKLVATGLVQVPYSAVLWVSRSSYLPLRLAFIPLNRATGPAGPQIDLRWLPPTRANLAKAAILPAPRGFAKVSWSS